MAAMSTFQALSAKSEGGAGAEEELAAVAALANSPAVAKETPTEPEDELAALPAAGCETELASQSANFLELAVLPRASSGEMGNCRVLYSLLKGRGGGQYRQIVAI